MKLSSVSVGSSSGIAQSLPMNYIERWPMWLATNPGELVLMPEASDSTENIEEQREGWVNPVAFEQIWMPKDLPKPTCCAAIGAVLKDGVPRYIFPCVETTITTVTTMPLENTVVSRVWHNRGLNSFPLAKTWMSFGDVPVDDLVLSCHTQPLPEVEVADEPSLEDAASLSAEELEKIILSKSEEADGEESIASWTEVLPRSAVKEAVDTIFDMVGSGPDAMGEGFCYLIAPLRSCPLPVETLVPGKRLQLVLFDRDAGECDPSDPPSRSGECDVAVYEVAEGGTSEFLPAAYKPLYAKSS
jgi:hypothetical protein